MTLTPEQVAGIVGSALAIIAGLAVRAFWNVAVQTRDAVVQLVVHVVGPDDNRDAGLLARTARLERATFHHVRRATDDTTHGSNP